MNNNRKKMFMAAAVLAFCIVLSLSSTSIQGRSKTYEVRPEITLPEYKTDTTKLIESYERILDRLITTNETDKLNLTSDISDVSEKLDSIDKKLDNVLKRLKKIEKALNIEEKEAISIDNSQIDLDTETGNN